MRTIQIRPVIFILIVLVALFSVNVIADEKEKKVQTKCPVSGKDIDKKAFVEHEGMIIYFCCEECIKEFKIDPAKYIQKLKDEGVELEKAKIPQTKCPISGGKINKSVFVDYKGMRIYFCCKSCAPKFIKDPEKFIKGFEEKGITLEKVKVPQTHCPVMDEEIDKSVFVDYKGMRVYFCCKDCIGKFEEDPEKFIKKLEDAGVSIEKTPEDKK